MKRTFEEALINRWSYYNLSSDSPVADYEVVHVFLNTKQKVDCSDDKKYMSLEDRVKVFG